MNKPIRKETHSSGVTYYLYEDEYTEMFYVEDEFYNGIYQEFDTFEEADDFFNKVML